MAKWFDSLGVCVKKKLSKLILARSPTSLLLGMAPERSVLVYWKLRNSIIDTVLQASYY